MCERDRVTERQRNRRRSIVRHREIETERPKGHKRDETIDFIDIIMLI